MGEPSSFSGSSGFGLRRFWPRTLRWRLQAWQGLLSICMITGFGLAVCELQRINRFRQIDAELQMRLTALSRTVRDAYRDAPGPPPDERGRGPRWPPPEPPGFRGPPPGGMRGEVPWRHHPPPPDRPFPPRHGPKEIPRPIALAPETAALFGPQEGYYFTLWYRDGTVIGRSENAPRGAPAPARSERDTMPHFRTRGIYREAMHCSGLGDCAMAGRSIAGDQRALAALAWLLAGAGAAILCLGLGVGWWIVSRAIAPIAEISDSARRIAEGNLSERVPIHDAGDELGRLASVLNVTFAQLDAAFARQQQFTADAAHELRTPLAIMISEAQTTLARPRSAEEYREAMEACLDTAQQMRKLTETLLDLSRLDNGEAAPRTRVDLAEAAAKCINRLQRLAAQRAIPLRPKLSAAPVNICAERIELVITNLVTNAIAYNRPGGEVLITTSQDQEHAILRVADTGLGIAPADLPHIFDRFYRADKARSRAEGHAGLGLAICKSILDAEHGKIEVESTPGAGTVFTIRLPAAT